jgi:DNA-binding NtrC family response regulator
MRRQIFRKISTWTLEFDMTSRRDRLDDGPNSHHQAALPAVCIITADEEFLEVVIPELSPWFQVIVGDDYANLARLTKEAHVSAVLLDIDTEGENPLGGLPVLNELRRLNENFTLISMSRARARSVEKQALSAGADAHFRNPVDVTDLRMALVETLRRRSEDSERERMRQQSFEASRFQDFVGASEQMRLVYDAIQQVAGSSINVLIRGESGTGKELAARAIVALSRRANKPYIRVNCAALPENLIESELFGSERGAFTGATESRPGQIELADGGTLFLDEIATLTVP